MSANIFEQVKDALHPRLDSVIPELLPGGRQNGREYVCGSLQGGPGDSCKTNLDTGRGSDFSTDESWGDVISLWSKIRNIRQGEAAKELADKYGIHLDGMPLAPKAVPPSAVPSAFTPIVPVPDNVPKPPPHPQHGQASALWRYADMEGHTLAYVARFDLPDGSKVILPLCYGSNGNGHRWHWKALPEPRPLYGLEKLATMPEAPVLLVEGEKTADAGQDYFPGHAVLTWSGGANAVTKADLSPLHGRKVIIWPDNDEPGFKAVLTLADLLEGKADVSITQPPDTLPEKWDLADATEPGFLPQVHITTAMTVKAFRQKAVKRYPALAPSIQESDDPADMPLKEWPSFPFEACPGIVGEFVRVFT